jgi:L-aminopeptidase/D-esterase-like protein
VRRGGPLLVALAVAAAAVALPRAEAGPPVRARDLGVPFAGQPGPLNAITDVPGVRVGHATLVAGGTDADAARTGVTVVLPNARLEPVFAGSFVLNGNGEATGLELIDEWGYLLSPIALTNTISVGTVRDAIVRWSLAQDDLAQKVNLPVVAETWDGLLNDIYGFHVGSEHVRAALAAADGGAVAEGNVGGGTGMVCHGFKGGIGTSSRLVEAGGKRYVVGVLVQANYGRREDLLVAGLPVGRAITDLQPDVTEADRPPTDASIIVVIATDAPLLPHQLARVARRAPLGLGRCGSHASTHSGDIVIAFGTRVPAAPDAVGVRRAAFLGEASIDAVFRGTVDAVEEAIVNALVAAETMTGRSGNTVHALPHDRLRELLRDHGRLRERQ